MVEQQLTRQMRGKCIAKHVWQYTFMHWWGGVWGVVNKSPSPIYTDNERVGCVMFRRDPPKAATRETSHVQPFVYLQTLDYYCNNNGIQ